MSTVPTRSFAQIRQALLDHAEVALIDVREEAPFAESHPLFAANIPLSKLELEVYSRIPRRDTQVTVYDNGEGLASRAAERLHMTQPPLTQAIQNWRTIQATLKEMQRLSRRVLFETVKNPPRRKRLGKKVLGLI